VPASLLYHLNHAFDCGALTVGGALPKLTWGTAGTHSFPRITSRTWKCDPYLARLANEVVMRNDSIVQLIHNSDVLRVHYSRNVRALQHNPIWNAQARSFPAAKHRFDTWSKPFATLCLTFDAVVATAQQVHEERRYEASGRHAKAFLSLLDEEMMISLGMMADAGDENMSLIRYLDSEYMDNTEISAECARFLDRITALFDKGGCVLTGYTAVMLKLVSKERVVFFDHKPKRVGGLDQESLARVCRQCLGRLANWAKLAREVLAAEFPHFESIQAFTALRLLSPEERMVQLGNADEEREAVTKKIQKLSQLLGLNEETLQDQFFDHFPIAQHEFDQNNCTAFVAWRAAVDRVRKGGVVAKKLKAHPVDSLVRVLLRAGAWGVSTSGVEQQFSAIRAVMTSDRSKLGDDHYTDEVFIISTRGQSTADDKELVEIAARVWVQVFGAPRRPATETRRMPSKAKGASPPAGSLKAGWDGEICNLYIVRRANRWNC